MLRLIIAIVSTLLFLSAHAQSNQAITIGKKETIQSVILGEQRKLWIYTPSNTATVVSPEKKYPVLYLLDGEAHFYSTVGLVQQLSQANGNGVLPEMIIVGIENTRRLRDLIPTSLAKNDMQKADPFVRFLSEELMPYVDQHYPTAPYKLLIGHSLGGLLGVHVLTQFPQLFNAIIAIDPSMWYGQQKFLDNVVSSFPQLTLSGRKLFIGAANTLPKGITLTQVAKDKSKETEHLRSILRLNDFLKKNTNGLQYAYQYYPNDRHNTVPLISIYDGLRYIFDYYIFDAGEKDFADSTILIAQRIQSHYQNISQQLGYQERPPEAFIQYMGYDALSKKHFEKAGAFFAMNVENFPLSSSAWDAYGDYWSTRKDTLKAIEFYKKALQLHQSTTITQKIELLSKKSSFQLTPQVLKKYAGTYILEAYKIDIVLVLQDGKLISKVPGQPDSEFIAVSQDVFTVKGKQGYTITFSMNGDQPQSFTSVQPNGSFKAVFKHE